MCVALPFFRIFTCVFTALLWKCTLDFACATVFSAFPLLDSGLLSPRFYPPGSAFPAVYKLLLPPGLKTILRLLFSFLMQWVLLFWVPLQYQESTFQCPLLKHYQYKTHAWWIQWTFLLKRSGSFVMVLMALTPRGLLPSFIHACLFPAASTKATTLRWKLRYCFVAQLSIQNSSAANPKPNC